MRNILVLLSCLCFALTGCNQNSGSGSNPNSANTLNPLTGQGTGIWLIVSIHAECAATTGTISISQYTGGAYMGAAIQTVAVANGGSVNFVVSPGNYMIAAQAGNCQMQGGPVTYQGAVQTFDLGLCSTTCGMPNGAQSFRQNSPSIFKTTALAASSFRSADETSCPWNVYGCQGQQDPGPGSITIQRAALNFAVKKTSDLSLNLIFTKGNNLLMGLPGLGDQGWKVSAQADGQVKVGDTSYGALTYDAQADDSLLQFNDGFCASRDAVPGKMVDYLKAAGFSDSTVAGFKAQWSNRMPPNANLCVYPQSETEIQEVVNYKASVGTSNHRMWFIVIPQQESAIQKIRAFPAKFAKTSNPKNDAFKMLKMKTGEKTRSVANSPDVSIEETAVGFMIER